MNIRINAELITRPAFDNSNYFDGKLNKSDQGST